MSARISVLLGAVALLGGLGIAATPPNFAAGTLTQNGRTVQLKSAVAVWDRAGNQIQIGLFPFIVDRDDIETMRGSGALFVATGKPSPAPGKWPSPPFAELVIEFPAGTRTITKGNVKYYALHVSSLDKMNHTVSANRNYQDEVRREFGTLRGNLRDGGTVEVALTGTQEFRSGTVLSWDFRVKSRISVK